MKTKEQTIKYPNVHCDRHPHVDAPGYIVCTHLCDNSTYYVGCVVDPKPDSLGEVLCIDCALIVRETRSMDRLKLVCAECTKEIVLRARRQFDRQKK